MAHEFESGFFAREPAWHGLGITVDEALSSSEALQIAGLDWKVEQKPVFVCGSEVPNYKANVRMTDETTLGIVRDKYQIVQNTEAFEFTDSLLGEGVKYETAGSLRGGKTIWLLARMDSTKILGDSIAPYLCFMNTHDGSSPVKVCMTPTRVVCNNTLNLALCTAVRSWTTRHVGNISYKLSEAQNTLLHAQDYMNALNNEAEVLAAQKITNSEIDKILEDMFGANENNGVRKQNNIAAAKEVFYICYAAPDLANFVGTKYGVINAMADLVDHREPTKMTKNYQENNFTRVINGHIFLDQMYERLTASV